MLIRLCFGHLAIIIHRIMMSMKSFGVIVVFRWTRDKMKLVLEDLKIPFYDPYLIIEKTEGRMAEDDFWIRIEK